MRSSFIPPSTHSRKEPLKTNLSEVATSKGFPAAAGFKYFVIGTGYVMDLALSFVHVVKTPHEREYCFLVE